jgi:hypothetical protein
MTMEPEVCCMLVSIAAIRQYVSTRGPLRHVIRFLARLPATVMLRRHK